MSWLVSWLVLSLSIGVTAALLPGFEIKAGWRSTVWVAALVGVLSFLLGRVLFFVIGVGTLGIGFLLAFVTRWVVMAIILKIADAMSTRLTIRSWSAAFVAALLMSGLGTAGEWLVARLL